MKRFTMMAVIALGGLLAFAPPAPAAEKPDDTKTQAKKAGQRERLKQVAEDLELTADQKAKLRPIFQEEAKKLKELRQDTSLSRPARREKLKEIQQDIRAQVKPILTAEQWEKWEKMRDEAQTRRRSR